VTPLSHPLHGPSPERVHLANAPLERVLAVVRFPPIAAISDDLFVTRFQEAIRDRYPIGHKAESVGFSVGPDGVQALSPDPFWRFRDLDEVWMVSLGPNFVGLETTRYTTREDFLGRFQQVFAAASEHIRPARRDRIGVRYIDRISGDPLARLVDLIHPSFLGLLSTDFAPHTPLGVSDFTVTARAERRVRVRSARLPPGATVDPNAVPPIDDESWVLDIDAATQKSAPWTEANIIDETAELADLAHRMFRWAIKPAFIQTFGGPDASSAL
jgi:uncharacterized protein (TIGR04255 family)